MLLYLSKFVMECEYSKHPGDYPEFPEDFKAKVSEMLFFSAPWIDWSAYFDIITHYTDIPSFLDDIKNTEYYKKYLPKHVYFRNGVPLN